MRRYLRTKHDWFVHQPGWRHTIAVPLVAAPPQEADGVAALLPSLPLFGSGGYRLPVDRAAVRRALVGLAPDLIEAGDPYRVAWGALDAGCRLGVPVVAYCHSNIEMMARMAAGRWLGGAAAAAARRYARHLYRRFDAVLAPSQSMCRHLIDWGIGNAECQSLGVDSSLFHPSRASPDWRTTLGLDADTRVLVYAGRFAAEKHLDVLAAAVGRLGGRHVLLAIGSGPAPPPAGKHVKIVPFVADAGMLATALASADAFVHAGDQETFGLSVLEAMACGTPVIARSAEGLAELVDDGVGIAVHAGTPAAFADAIESFFAGGRHARAVAARQRAEQHDWSRVLPAVAARYVRLLDAAAAPDPRRRSPLGSRPS